MANSVVRLGIDSHEFDANIKRAGEALNKFFDQAKKGDRTFEVLDDDVMEVVKAFGSMETKSKSARGQISELTKGFTDFSMIYKQLTAAEKASPVGQEMVKQLDILKGRIDDTKKNLAEIDQELSGSKFGEFGGLIDSVGKKMGINANITELLTSKTALMTAGIGAGIAIVGQAADAWARYNQELSRQDQVTTVTTGLKGPAANAMTDAARSIADVYNVDFREVINAANTLMTQFGQSGSQAIQLIRDGMQGMIQGDGPKLLSMIQQYAPSFRDAGISASQLVAIIHNSEGGIFTDQNMNAIVMGIKNIRLMTNQTSEALAKMGIDGADMTRKLNAGTMTVFEALGQVSNAIERTGSGSQAAGEVMQYVFGRQGAVAGTKLGEAIATLNTNLNETKRQTGDLGAAFAELQTANERLNKAIREAFEYDGWEQMTVGIKTGLLDALSSVLETTIKIKESWVGDIAGTIFDAAKQGAIQSLGALGNVLDLVLKIKNALKGDDTSGDVGAGLGARLGSLIPNSVRQPYEDIERLKKAKVTDRKGEYEKTVAAYNANIASSRATVNQYKSLWGDAPTAIEIKKVLDEERKRLQELQAAKAAYISGAQSVLNPPTTPHIDHNKPTKHTTSPARELDPMQRAQQQITDLTKEALTADDSRLEVIRKEIAALQEQVKVYQSIQDFVQGEEPNWNIQVGDRKAFEAEQKKIFEANGGTASRLQSMEYSVKTEIKAEDIKIDTRTLHTLLKDALQNGIDTISLNLEPLAEQIGEGVNVPDEKWQEILDKYNELRAAIGEEPIQIDLNTGDKSINSENATGASIMNKMAGGISNIAGGIEQLGIKLPEGLQAVLSGIQGITTILSGISTIVSAIEVLSSIGSIPFFARGGIAHAANGFVPGNRYSTDDIPVAVSSGELILNRAQQGNLASQLQEGNSGRATALPYVLGQNIYLGTNNYLKGIGQGQLVTTQMLRSRGINI